MSGRYGIPSALVRQLIARRHELNMSQIDVDLNMDKNSQCGKWESGVRNPQLDSLENRCEVKGRAASRIFWKLIKKYITGVSYLVLVEDRQPPLVVMHWDDFVKYQKLKGKNVCTHPSKNNEAH